MDTLYVQDDYFVVYNPEREYDEMGGGPYVGAYEVRRTLEDGSSVVEFVNPQFPAACGACVQMALSLAKKPWEWAIEGDPEEPSVNPDGSVNDGNEVH